MDTGISPSGTGHVHRLPFDRSNHLFERALDRIESRLDLPAMEVRPVISDRDFDAPHESLLLVMKQVSQLRASECTRGAGHRFPWPASRSVQGKRKKQIAFPTCTQLTH